MKLIYKLLTRPFVSCKNFPIQVSHFSRFQNKYKSSSHSKSLSQFPLHLTRIILSMVILFNITSCAIFQKKNLRLASGVEEHIVPKDTTWKILTAPIYIPLGIAAGLVDVFFLHPVSVIPSAGEDTISALWTPKGLGYYTQMGAVPFSIIASPPFFLLSWSYHWFFHAGDSETEEPEARPTTAEWQTQMKNIIEDKNLEEYFKHITDSIHYQDDPNTIEILIQAHKTFQYNSRAGVLALDGIMSYPTENERARKYILNIYSQQLGQTDTSYYISNCKHIECRQAVLKKIQDPNVNMERLLNLLRTYADIATEEEKELLKKQIQGRKTESP